MLKRKIVALCLGLLLSKKYLFGKMLAFVSGMFDSDAVT